MSTKLSYSQLCLSSVNPNGFLYGAIFSTALVSMNLGAGGFEKATTWSAKNASMGSAVVSTVSGADALYFNPAGLGSSKGIEVSANFSPTWSKYEAPFNRGTSLNTIDTEGDRKLSPVFGVLASYELIQNLGIGAGYFVSGGSKAVFEELDYANYGVTGFEPDQKTELALTEFSLGAGYLIAEGFSVGAAWRYSMVNANLSTAVPAAGPSVTQLAYKDLSDSNAATFRVGAQFKQERWGLGANLRTPLEFAAKGKIEADTAVTTGEPTANTSQGDGKDVTVTATFPLQFEVGSHVEPIKGLTVAVVYGWTNYSVNQDLAVKTEGTAGETLNVLDWDDQHHVRLGLQYAVTPETNIRGGYVFVSQVVPEEYANPTYSSPGIAHVMTLGAGHFFAKNLEISAGVELSMASGNGLANSSINAEGEYSSSGIAFHTGVNYHF